jgi:hypothetical protein
MSRLPGFLSTLTLAALGVAAGCATSSHTTGRPILQEKVDSIVKGKTTVDEIIESFGAPTSQTEMGGNVLHTYTHTVTKRSGFSIAYYSEQKGRTQTDGLTITFDKATGRVKTCSDQHPARNQELSHGRGQDRSACLAAQSKRNTRRTERVCRPEEA